jgi:hypothetical protein
MIKLALVFTTKWVLQACLLVMATFNLTQPGVLYPWIAETVDFSEDMYPVTL